MEEQGTSALAWAALCLTLAHLLVKVLSTFVRQRPEPHVQRGLNQDDRDLLTEIRTLHAERSSTILAIQTRQFEILRSIEAEVRRLASANDDN